MISRRTSILGVAAVSVLASAAFAQNADTQAILDALNKISGRLDDMQTQIDELKGSQPAPSSKATSGTSVPKDGASVGGPPAGMVPRPGWMVGALPYERDNPEPDPVFFFEIVRTPFTLNEHMVRSKSTNWFRYKGEAKLNIFESGRHGFAIEIEAPASGQVGCWGYLRVDGNDVLWVGDSRRSHDVDPGRSQTFSGAVDLVEGNYDVSFRISCTPYSYGPEPSYKESLDKIWRAARISILMRGPGDFEPRQLEPRELFYYARADTATKSESQSTSVKAGEQRILTSGVNIRSQARTTSSVVLQAQSGMRIDVDTVSPDGEWASVSIGGQRVGFVKVTALVANSN